MKYIGKKHFIQFLFSFAFLLVFCTCNDPVFYAISQEVKPINPRIRGTPTNFVEFNNYMYVASGIVLYKYNGNNKPYWDYAVLTGGIILQLASANNRLYALCVPNYSNIEYTVIKYNGSNPLDSNWIPLSGPIRIQNIYKAGNRIFLFANTSPPGAAYASYAIYYINDNDPTPSINSIDIPNAGELCGAAYDGTYYFLATKDKRVYRIDSANAVTLIQPDTPADTITDNITGIINLDNSAKTILIITREGKTYTIDGSNNIKYTYVYFGGKQSNGALAIWEDDHSNRLLLAGRQDELRYSTSSGYAYGYLELELDNSAPNGIKAGAYFDEPGKKLLSSIWFGGNESYQSTIGKQPVTHIFQVPSSVDSKRPVFAATQKSGVWSYRERYPGPVYQWNAEGENEPNY